MSQDQSKYAWGSSYISLVTFFLQEKQTNKNFVRLPLQDASEGRFHFLKIVFLFCHENHHQTMRLCNKKLHVPRLSSFAYSCQHFQRVEQSMLFYYCFNKRPTCGVEEIAQLTILPCPALTTVTYFILETTWPQQWDSLLIHLKASKGVSSCNFH